MKLRYIKPFDWLFIVLNLVMIYAHTVTNSSLGFALLHFVLIGFLLWMCSYFGKKMDKHEETMT